MSRIARVTQKLFGSSGSTSDFGEFGSKAAGAPATTKSPATIQALSAFLTGFTAATVAQDRPYLEDMNALFLLAFQQIAYGLQLGVPEWDSGTTYFIGSLVNDGTGILYKSLIDNNLNNALSDGTKWALLIPATYSPTALNALVGSVIQHKIFTDNTPASGSGSTYFGAGLPVNTTGDPYTAMNTAIGTITPSKTGNIIVFEANVSFYVTGSGNSATGVLALFTNLSANAIASAYTGIGGAGSGFTANLRVTGFVIAPNTSPITPSLRVAGFAGGWSMLADAKNNFTMYEIAT